MMRAHKGSLKDLQHILTVSAELDLEIGIVTANDFNHVQGVIGRPNFCFNVSAWSRNLKVADNSLLNYCVGRQNYHGGSSTTMLSTILAGAPVRIDTQQMFRDGGINHTHFPFVIKPLVGDRRSGFNRDMSDRQE